MSDDEIVRMCLAAWNNVPADHPSMSYLVDEGTRRAWLRVAGAVRRAFAQEFFTDGEDTP